MNDSSYIVVGKIGASFGIYGWLKVTAYTEFGPDILNFSPWYLSRENTHPTPAPLEASKRQGNKILVKFKELDSPEAAATLTGSLISIQRSQLPPLKKDEFYWSDLVGLKVVNTKGEDLGIVKYLLATGANDVLVVKGTKEHAVPFLMHKVILKVDLAQRLITVDWDPL